MELELFVATLHFQAPSIEDNPTDHVAEGQVNICTWCVQMKQVRGARCKKFKHTQQTFGQQRQLVSEHAGCQCCLCGKEKNLMLVEAACQAEYEPSRRVFEFVYTCVECRQKFVVTKAANENEAA